MPSNKINIFIDGIWQDRTLASLILSGRFLLMAIRNLITNTIISPLTPRGHLLLTLSPSACKAAGADTNSSELSESRALLYRTNNRRDAGVVPPPHACLSALIGDSASKTNQDMDFQSLN